MNLMDDFLFWTLMAHEEFGPKAARYMLSTILQQQLGEVDVHAQKVLYGWKRTQHGIRMDAYIKEHDSPDVSGSLKTEYCWLSGYPARGVGTYPAHPSHPLRQPVWASRSTSMLFLFRSETG
jgi:hypothetical protein